MLGFHEKKKEKEKNFVQIVICEAVIMLIFCQLCSVTKVTKYDVLALSFNSFVKIWSSDNELYVSMIISCYCYMCYI